MLMVITNFMEVLKDNKPEELLVKTQKQGFTCFEGLPQEKEGRQEALRSSRAAGVAAFLKGYSTTKAAILRCLEGLSCTPAPEKSDLGQRAWKSDASFEQRTAQGMPRRWPPQKTREEQLTERGQRQLTTSRPSRWA